MTAHPTAPLPASDPPVLVIRPPDHDQDEKVAPDKADSPSQLVLGFIFGIVFGFLLQKGGVANYEVLMGQFLLTDFTVIKIILTAIVVGIWSASSRCMRWGLVKLHVKPTRYATNITGGLLFGVGLGLLGYLPRNRGGGVRAGSLRCDTRYRGADGGKLYLR